MKWFKDLARVFKNEWMQMLHDTGLLIFFIALPLLYPIVYTLIYNPEVVRKLPVAIVDDCRSTESRQLVQQASAAPEFSVYAYCPNMADAKKLWAEQEVYAILHIPSNYSRDLANLKQAHAQLYCDCSLLLRYRQLLSAMTSLQIEMTSEITSNRVSQLGAQSLMTTGMPIKSDSEFLGDTQQGFASFVIPGIVVLILQQSMILGIGLLGGTARERRRKNGGYDPKGVNDANSYATVWGKALAYTLFYIPFTIYILHFVPMMFNLPHFGSPMQYLPFIFPLLLASAFLGQAMVTLIYEREYVFLVVVFLSVIFLFLSGLTWPRYAMSDGWFAAGNLIPATWGVEGFIRINSNAATLADNARPFIAMWIQVGVYSILAALCWRWLLLRDKMLSMRTKAVQQ